MSREGFELYLTSCSNNMSGFLLFYFFEEEFEFWRRRMSFVIVRSS